MMGYTKLFSEIVMSTVWREPNHVRILWITMLALKDRWHVVNASVPGLADAARITIEECEDALKILSDPDRHSRSTEFEGRRIEPCDEGWMILNGEKYRNKMSLDERREYQRIKQREYRQKKKMSNSCQQSSQQLTDTYTDTETYTDTDQKRGANKSPSRFKKPSLEEMQAYREEKSLQIDIEHFIDYYDSNGWKVGKNPMKDWKATMRNWARREKQATKKEEIPNYRDIDKLVAYGKRHGIEPKRGEDAYPYWQRVKEAL